MGLEKILVLEDEAVLRRTLEEHLRRKRYTVAAVDTIARAEELLAQDEFDVVFLDSRLPDGDGTQMLERHARKPDAPLFVVVTGFGSIESAVGCMRAGAFDYLLKPFSLAQIDVLLGKAESFNQLVKVNQYFAREAGGDTELVGDSAAMRSLRQLVGKVAPTEATVLISGENGTGKELVANELFRRSNRAGKPFIRVNCAAVSDTLIESEFFGHEKGAFTNALQKREGRFELANNGTILLDEVSEITPRLQAKLLRVLQEREFERVGGNKTIKVNVRVIATTNRDLQKSVERGEFRQDLYFRLAVFPIQVPALRTRKDDITGLANFFLERFSRKHGVRVRGIAADAIAMLLAHDWPGNVRELQNTIERAVILTESGAPLRGAALGLFMPAVAASASTAATAAALVPPVAAHESAELSAPSLPLPDLNGSAINGSTESLAPLEEVEKQHILLMLERTSGNRVQAAKHLGISERTLRNKLALYREQGIPIVGDD
jgi:two-component system, NtrC family, response regulator AtoC